MNFRQLFEDNKITTIRGPHGRLDVDRSEKGVTRVQRQTWSDTNSRGGSDYEPTGKRGRPVGIQYGPGGDTHGGGVGIPHPTGFSDVHSDRSAGRRQPRLDRDDEFTEGTGQSTPITDYNIWRDKVSTAGGEIHPQQDRNRLVAQSWDGDVIGEFNLRTNQGWFGQQGVAEDWQKVNKSDKTDGMSSKAVKAYRRENPGSKLKTAVTTKPSKLKKGSKSAKRRKSFCARMSGMKKAHASAKTKRDPDSPINKALRRWNCESIEELQQLAVIAEQKIQAIKEAANPAQQAAIAINMKKHHKKPKGVAEGKGDFAQAIENLHGWHEVESSNPDIRIWEFDDREGGHYAEGTVYYIEKTGRIQIEFEDHDGYHGGDVTDAFDSIGDAMNVLKNITVQVRPNTGKARDFDKLGGRTVAGPDDLYKTDRVGRKGTLNKTRMDIMKASSPYRKTGPEGQLPEQDVDEGLKGKIAGAALAAANLLGSPAAAQEPVKPITIAYVQIDGEVRKYNLGDKFSNAKEAEQFISAVLDKQGISGYTLDIKHGYPKQKTDEAGQGVTETTGDPKFDKMLKGITGKRQVAKQQKTDTKQQARDAFGGMFGGGNPADKLSIRKKGVAEENKGLYYNVNKRKKAGTSRDADSPKAPTAQAWKDAAKTAKKESVAEGEYKDTVDKSKIPAVQRKAQGGDWKVSTRDLEHERSKSPTGAAGLAKAKQRLDMTENLRQLPPEVIELLKKVTQSDAAPEHKKAIINSIMAKYQPVKDIAETPTRTAREKFNQGLKRAGFDPEAAAKRLTDLIAKQKAEREKFEKENPAAYGDDSAVKEEKVRLDPKCWTGKKIGNPRTKVKGGVRVNNCVPK